MNSLSPGGEMAIQGWPDFANRTAPLLKSADAETENARENAGWTERQAINASCPQDQDCPLGAAASPIFECQEGCGFRGCYACMEIHESEPHASDSMTSLEMARNTGGAR